MPPILAQCKLLHLVPEEQRVAFIHAVARVLSGALPAAELPQRFGLSFSDDDRSAALLLGVKALLVSPVGEG